ncbi:MAG: hypothetical protein NC133_03845 [Prevotella sp.]|nr:hypothetical protein [Prevotella sp.]
MNLKLLRALNQAQIRTLLDQGRDSDELMRAQVVAKILADDQCFQKLPQEEIVTVLTALGYQPACARDQAAQIKRQVNNG